MKGFRRFKSLTVVLAVLMVISLIGCSKDAGTDKEKQDTKKQETSADTKAKEVSKESSKDEVVTIDWFYACDWFHKKWDEENTALDKMITEDTGLRINFSSGKLEKLSALIAAGDLPDVISADKASPQALLLQKEGMVLPIMDLVKEYAPDFNVPKSMQEWHAREDGKLYGIVNYFYAPEKLKEGENLPTHTLMVARKDIMDQLGLKSEDFETKEGTIAALKKVRDSGITFNGFNLEPTYLEPNTLINMFAPRREDEKGNYVDRAHEPEALEAYKFMNELYREKLLPVEALTLNQQQIVQKVGQGSIFSYNCSLYSNAPVLASVDENAYFEKIGPVRNAAGDEPYFDPSPMAGWLITMINSKTQYPDKIINLFKYCYNEDEKHLEMRNGPKGVTWDYDADGKLKLFDDVKAEMDADNEKAKLKYGHGTMGMFMDWIAIMRTESVPTNVPEKALWDAYRYFENYSYPDLAFSSGVPEAGTDLSAIKAKIDEYVKKMQPKIIMAKSEQEVEKLFKEMIAHKKELGYDDLFKYQSDKFKEAKEKLGLEFAWPANQK